MVASAAALGGSMTPAFTPLECGVVTAPAELPHDGAGARPRGPAARSYPHRLTIDVEPEVYEALRVHAFRQRTNVAELVRHMGRRLLAEDRSLAREVRQRLDGGGSRERR